MDITPAQGQIAGPEKHASTYGDSFKRIFGGIHFQYPGYKHDHPPVIDVNKVADDQLTTGQRVADRVAATIGSWRFIIIQGVVLMLWILLNSLAFTFHWDNYPYVLCNLALSFEAAFSAPFIMMSQNRQAEKDRLTAQNDYTTDCKGEEEIRYIMEHLDHQDTLILQIVKRLEEQHMEMKEHLAKLDPTLVQRLGSDIVKLSEESLAEDEEISGNS